MDFDASQTGPADLHYAFYKLNFEDTKPRVEFVDDALGLPPREGGLSSASFG